MATLLSVTKHEIFTFMLHTDCNDFKLNGWSKYYETDYFTSEMVNLTVTGHENVVQRFWIFVEVQCTCSFAAPFADNVWYIGSI